MLRTRGTGYAMQHDRITDDLSSMTIPHLRRRPDEVGGWDKDYDYTVTMTVAGTETASADITVTVLEKPDIKSCLSFGTYTVDEGDSDFELVGCLNDPTGAPEGSEYKYNWTVLGETPLDDLSLLEEIDTSTPVFKVPDDVEENVIYEYLYTISADNADEFTAQYRIVVRNINQTEFNLVCGSSSIFRIYQGSDDIELNCQALGVPEGAIWEWTARETTSNTDRLSATDIPNPVFDVPGYDIDIDNRLDFYYTVSVSKDSKSEKLDILVGVINPYLLYEYKCFPQASFFEGDNNGTIGNCFVKFNGDPIPYDQFNWEWTAREATSNTDRLSATDIPNPVFDVPDSIDNHEIYEYTLEITRTRPATRISYLVSVSVLDRDSFDGVLAITCTEYYYEFYEGSENFEFSCSASGAPDGAEYSYRWNPIGNTENLGNLLGARSPNPTFLVPSDVSEDEVYSYRLTVTSTDGNSIPASAVVVVTVKNKPSITVTCPGDSYGAYEGEGDILLDCKATGKPSDSEYVYAWTARGGDTSRLSSTTIEQPTFEAPGSVNSDETYEYTLTVSADNAEDGFANVTVTVKNKPSITVTCPGDPYGAYEGEGDILLDCEATGKPSDSDYVYAWTARGGGDTSRLSSTTVEKPTFHVPDEVDGDETYEYTLTVSADNAESATEDVTVKVLKKATLTLVCTSPAPVYEGSADFDLNCSASGAPSGSDYVYEWTARGSTVVPGQLSSTTVEKPTFHVPDEVDSDETYEYTLTVSADNAESATEDVTVTVLNKPSLTLICTPPAPVYEGAEDFDLDCSASGAPSGSAPVYVWTARGGGDTSRLSSTTVEKPTFHVPDEVDSDETYEYTLTVSADNAESATEDVTVTVLNKKALDLACATPSPVYEGSEDFALDCAASGAPVGSDYEYVWTARGSTANTDLLISGVDDPAPTFDVPEEVDEDETYEYLLTVSAENAESATAEVTVKVLNLGSIALVCASPPLVYEGSEDFALDCSVSGDTGDIDYAYEWAAIGATPNTSRLSAVDISSPTFYVPDALDETTTYEYLLTARTENAEDATVEVSVTVLNRGTLAVACAPPPLVYEGAADFDLDCSASGAPSGSDYEYVWTARGSTANTDLLISGVDGPTPTFSVPDALDATTTYEYLLTVSADNAESATAEVMVKVLNLGSIALVCASPPLVYEGSEDFALDCSVSGDTGDVDYAYEWAAIGATPNTSRLSAADIPSPTFYVPDALDETTTYEYLLTASAANAESSSARVTVTVLNKKTLDVACATPSPVYEGSEDFALDCAASGAPGGSGYTYVWTDRGATANTDRLISGADGPAPTFSVPDALDATTTYEYLLTVSADNAVDATAEVTVKVLNLGSIALVCASPPLVYEGSEDFALDCSVSGDTGDVDYAYEWAAIGATPNTSRLSAVDISSPTFYVPDALDETTTYEYLLTASAANAESSSARVTVTVLNKKTLDVACATPSPVYEGSEDFALDCAASGAPGGSGYTYVWTDRGATANTDRLISGADGPAPTFSVPDALDATTTYEYLLTVSADNAVDATAEVTVKVLNLGSIALVCASPPLVYEGSEDFALDCSVSGDTGDVDYAYEWAAIGATPNTSRLSAADIPSPTFDVPEEVDEDETYEYLLTVSAENADPATAEVTVKVLNLGSIALVCASPPLVYEGSADIAFDCAASGAPAGSAYEYEWTARNSTANTDLLIAGADGPAPTFDVPEEVDEDETYEYLLTVSAENAVDAAAEVSVTVLNKEALALVCADPGSVYEGSADIAFDCSASGAPAGSAYVYSWIVQGATPNTSRLSAVDIPSPTFYVPDEVAEDETYEYLLTVSAENAIDASADVTVTVLNRGALALVCADPGSVYEGSADIAFDCSASGAPGDDPQYTYAWTARGDTPDTALLSAADVSSPMFYVPEEVEEDETYEYLLTVSAENAVDASAEVTVTVLNRGACARVRGSGFGIRGLGRHRVRLLGVRGSCGTLPTNTPGRPEALRQIRRCLALRTFPRRRSMCRKRWKKTRRTSTR